MTSGLEVLVSSATCIGSGKCFARRMAAAPKPPIRGCFFRCFIHQESLSTTSVLNEKFRDLDQIYLSGIQLLAIAQLASSCPLGSVVLKK